MFFEFVLICEFSHHSSFFYSNIHRDCELMTKLSITHGPFKQLLKFSETKKCENVQNSISLL
jgi:hypothetical protein